MELSLTQSALRVAASAAEEHSAPVSLLSVTTLVLWVGCLGVGVIGLCFPHRPPPDPPKAPKSTQAEIVHVALTRDDLVAAEPMPDQIQPNVPPPLAASPPLASAPPLVAVAEPGSAIAFARPVEGPARMVEANQAACAVTPSDSPAPSTAAAPPVQKLVYGQGDGKQPAPEYPPRAVREGQEGTVRVQIVVGENGRVLAADCTGACPWRLLNEAAVRVVRERWRFRAGPPRRYEVSIRFELSK